jgi:hypothetical protein
MTNLNLKAALKNAMAFSMALTLAVTMTACTEEDVATALGAAAIVAGAVVIANNTTCVSGYREVCSTHYTYRGRRITECRQVYDSCLYTRIGNLASASDAGVAEAVVTDVNWASTFNVGFEGSAKFVDALKMAYHDKQLDGLNALGLSKGAVKKIAKGEMPSEKHIDALAQNLDLSLESTRDMLSTLIDKHQQLQAAQKQAK